MSLMVTIWFSAVRYHRHRRLIDGEGEVDHCRAVAVCSFALIRSCQHRPALRVIGTRLKRQQRPVLRDGHIHTPGAVDHWTPAAKSVPTDRYWRAGVTGCCTEELRKCIVVREMHALRNVSQLRPFCTK